MKIVAQLLGKAETLTYSKEELEATEAEINEELESIPETPEEVEVQDVEAAEDEALETADTECDDAEEACGDLVECEQSLESLVEFLSLESGDLTGREYAIIMATANGYLSKAGIDSDVMSFEESTALTVVPREAAKATLKDKAKEIGQGIIEAIKKLFASAAEWFTGIFVKAKRLRNQLTGLAKHLRTVGGKNVKVTVPAKYAAAMANDVQIKMNAANHVVLGERLGLLAKMANSCAMPRMGEGLVGIKAKGLENTGLPGNPTLPPMDLDADKDYQTTNVFKVGSMKGEADVEIDFDAAKASTDVAHLIQGLDALLHVEPQWKQIQSSCSKATELLKQHGATDADVTFRKVVVFFIGRMFNNGVKGYVNYLMNLISLRAGGWAYASKHANAGHGVEGEATPA